MPTGTVVKHNLPPLMRQDMPFGAYVKGCDKSCPHYERCRFQNTRPGRAEDAEVGCEVLVKDLAAWAAGVDADPEYRAWQATCQIRQRGAELRGSAGEAT
jgi:hypothetical protein